MQKKTSASTSLSAVSSSRRDAMASMIFTAAGVAINDDFLPRHRGCSKDSPGKGPLEGIPKYFGNDIMNALLRD